MDTNQNKIIELLREAHLIAFKEIELLTMGIAELEIQNPQPFEKPVIKQPIMKPPAMNPATVTPPPDPKQSDLLNEHELASYVKLSVASLRRWRLLRQGPKFLKIGAAVRYKCSDVEAWLNSCAGSK